MLYGIAAATASFLLAALLAGVLRAPALALALVDRRRRRPVPLSGGVAVALVTALVAWAGDWTGVVPLGSAAGRLLLGASAVGVLGLAADLWRLRRRWVVAGTAVAAACVVPYGETGPVAGVLAVGWITLIASAFRGLDHADGVACTVGVVTSFGVAACAAAELRDGLAVALLALAAALTGLLLHNWHPARIALGACGALFAGFLLAGGAVFTREGYAPASGAAVLFALSAPVCLDVVLVLLSRRLAGRPPLRGGPDHLAHRLRRLGLTPQGAAVVVGGASCGAVLVGVLVHTGRLDGTAVWWVAGAAVAALAGLLRVRVYGPRRGAGAAGVPGQVSGRPRARGQAEGPVSGRPQARVRRPRTESQLLPEVIGPPRGASSRGSIFPVRQARRTEEAQVSAPLRVRNG
ncbi:MraY family glycosyltransferase [Streptomyces sp. NPDC000349]|uniref:MraY family glycosyltransferase n=1 Tax=Streptomyces sp. NPDC000349 TaxID=3154249 RepID=UPI002780C8B7|nr:MraY family glycosyltransferase [Streptomyces sp. DSM 40167]MDQ0405197.1 UDP-GlcNAc:undecaprenyl-phosphate GlcNAc-1-phosphate transferase [Streptomyces sp. DSM 40167]